MRVRWLLCSLCAPVLLAVALAAVSAPIAAAAEIRLRSGKALEFETLQIEKRAVRVSMRRDGGTIEALLPFKRLDAIAFLKTPYAKLLTPMQRKRFEVLAYLQHRLAERAKARKAKKPEKVDEPDELEPAAPPAPKPRPAPEAEDPPEEQGGNVPTPRTGADERFRDRRPWSRPRPQVPGTARPGGSSGGSSGGGSSGGAKGGSGGGASSGGDGLGTK